MLLNLKIIGIKVNDIEVKVEMYIGDGQYDNGYDINIEFWDPTKTIQFGGRQEFIDYTDRGYRNFSKTFNVPVPVYYREIAVKIWTDNSDGTRFTEFGITVLPNGEKKKWGNENNQTASGERYYGEPYYNGWPHTPTDIIANDGLASSFVGNDNTVGWIYAASDAGPRFRWYTGISYEVPPRVMTVETDYITFDFDNYRYEGTPFIGDEYSTGDSASQGKIYKNPSYNSSDTNEKTGTNMSLTDIMYCCVFKDDDIDKYSFFNVNSSNEYIQKAYAYVINTAQLPDYDNMYDELFKIRSDFGQFGYNNAYYKIKTITEYKGS